jgi:hypothetical protein
VVDKDPVKAAIAEDGAAKLGDFGWGLQPALRLGVESAQRLQVPVLRFVERLNPDGCCHIEDVSGDGHTLFLPFLLAFAVVADASAAGGTFRGAVAEDEFSSLFVSADNVRFATGSLHFAQGPECALVRDQPIVKVCPLKTVVSLSVFRKAFFQGLEKRFPFLF